MSLAFRVLTPEDLKRHERARKAITVARPIMRRKWLPMARILSRNPKLQMELTAGATSCAQKDIIWVRCPPELGDLPEHDRSACGKRDDNLIQRCRACMILEDVDITVIHEVAHIVKGTFEKVKPGDIGEVLAHAIRLEARDNPESQRAQKIRERIEDTRIPRHDYMNLSNLVSPYLPLLINACEDVRVNCLMMEDRPGTRVMFEAQTNRIFSEGVEDYDGRMCKWSEAPPNAQAMIAVYCKVSGISWADKIAPGLAARLNDERLDALCRTIAGATSIRQVYRYSIPLLENLRRLGFMKSPEDPEDEMPQPDKSEEGDQSEDQAGDSGEGSTQEGADAGDMGTDQQDGDRSDSDGEPGDASGGSENHEGDSDPGESDSDAGSGGQSPPGSSESGRTDDADLGSSNSSGEESEPAGDSESADEGTSPEGSGSSDQEDSTESHNDGGTESSDGSDSSEGSSRQHSGEAPADGDASGDELGRDQGDDQPLQPDDEATSDGGGSTDQEASRDNADPSSGKDSTSDSTQASSSGASEGDESSDSSDDSGRAGTEDRPDSDGNLGQDSDSRSDVPGDGEPSEEAQSDGGRDRSSSDGGNDEIDFNDASDGSQSSTSVGESEPSGGDNYLESPSSPDDSEESESSGSEADERSRAGGPHSGEVSTRSPDPSAGVDQEDQPTDLPDSSPEGHDSDDLAAGSPEDAAGDTSEGTDPAGDSSSDKDTVEAGYPHPEPYSEADQKRDGMPEEVERLLKIFGRHEDKAKVSPSERIEESAMQDAMETALRQIDFFDSPSLQIDGVHVTRHEDKHGAWSGRRGRYEDEDDLTVEERVIAPSLLKLRLAFTENQRGKKEPNLRAGKVNTRVLGRRAPVGDDRLFQKKRQPQKRDWCVVLGLDCSGSTSWPIGDGRHRLLLMKEATYAMAEMLHRIGITFAIYAHSGSNSELEIFVIKEPEDKWDRKAKAALAALAPFSGNLDGHTLEYYRKVAQRRPETEKAILYFTDGHMPASNYEEELEVLQHNIKVCRDQGIKLVGIGVNSDAPTEHGLDTILLDVIEDIPKVVDGLRRRIQG